MKFLHTADLHIGKKIYELPLIEDQKHILSQIYTIACTEGVDAVLIAGDVYDRALPPAEAVTLLDDFLTKLIGHGIKALMISGNHDSPERIAFGEAMLDKQGLYIAGNYSEMPKQVVLQDAWGEVCFTLMPFVKPAVTGYVTNEQAVRHMLGQCGRNVKEGQRRVLMTHYFVVGENGEQPLLSEAETDVSVGGLDGVSAGCFEGFDYVALGHIHKAQQVGGSNIYYAGAPMKYAFSEALTDKSVQIVELGAKGQIQVSKRVLTPLHEMRCIRGRLEELMRQELIEGSEREDYLQVTLTDTEELIDPIGTLRSVYPNVLQLLLEKNIASEYAEYESRISGELKSTTELFGEFYEMLKGEPMDETRKLLVEEVAREAEEQGIRS